MAVSSKFSFHNKDIMNMAFYLKTKKKWGDKLSSLLTCTDFLQIGKKQVVLGIHG